jgi:hypothetical protein
LSTSISSACGLSNSISSSVELISLSLSPEISSSTSNSSSLALSGFPIKKTNIYLEKYLGTNKLKAFGNNYSTPTCKAGIWKEV